MIDTIQYVVIVMNNIPIGIPQSDLHINNKTVYAKFVPNIRAVRIPKIKMKTFEYIILVRFETLT